MGFHNIAQRGRDRHRETERTIKKNYFKKTRKRRVYVCLFYNVVTDRVRDG